MNTNPSDETNDNIMDAWLEQNPPNENNQIIVSTNRKIPLSVGAYLAWLGNHSGLIFIFPLALEGLEMSLFTVKGKYIQLKVYHLPVEEGGIRYKGLDLVDTIFDIDTKFSKFGSVIIPTLGRHGKEGYKSLIQVISEYCDERLRPKYTRLGKRDEENFRRTKNLWMDTFKDYFLTKVSAINLDFSSQIPEKAEFSGQKFETIIELSYTNLSFNDRKKLIVDKEFKENEVKNLLNLHNDFGSYFMNVFSVVLASVHLDFPNTKAVIKVNAEMITSDDYYETIGSYRKIFENICVNKLYNPQGISKLLNDLGVEYQEDEDLCDIAKEVVSNLRWSDFSYD